MIAQLDLWSTAAPVAPAPSTIPPPLPAIDWLQRARDLLHSIGCHVLADSVEVLWNPRMRTTAGLADYRHTRVTLNPRIRPFGEAEIDRTLRHELAHLVARSRSRRRIEPHGPEWRHACRDLGLHDETRCHDLPLPRREIARRHLYRCPACGLEIPRVRPIRRRVACLPCCRAHAGGRYDDRFRLAKVPAR